ncbi:MAG: integrase [Planctomycetaceae bacterium]|nr:integrase [Planctomycetaceae bacterium]
MPRISGHSVPKYRKHRASGQAVVTINGHDHYLGPHGTKASRIEYDRLITEWLASGRSASYGTPAAVVTVVELANDYVKFAKRHYGDAFNSEWRRVKFIIRPLVDLYGRTAAADFGVLQLKSLREKFIATGRSRGTINSDVRRIVRFFRWAAAEGRVPPSVPQALAMVPGLRKGKSDARETAPVLPVDDATIDATLPHLPEVVADMVRFQRATGCRPAEVCNLRPCDVDLSSEVWLYQPPNHKTAHHGKERTIFIGPKGQAVLLKYLARDPEAHCFQPRDSEAKRLAAQHAARKTPLSCGNRPGTNKARKPKKRPGDKYDTQSYGAAVRRGAEKAGVEKWSPNRLRHAAATEIRREFGLEAAQVVLGHAKADVTQVYAERDLAKGYEVAKRIG